MNSKDKKLFQSKKFIALVVGVSFTTVFTFLALIAIAFIPEVASSIVNLITVSLAAMNGVVGIYALGQSVVDYQINSNHETNQTNIYSTTKEIVENAKKMEMQCEGSSAINWDEYEQVLKKS